MVTLGMHQTLTATHTQWIDDIVHWQEPRDSAQDTTKWKPIIKYASDSAQPNVNDDSDMAADQVPY